MPSKFLLVIGHILLLSLVLYLRVNHLFWEAFDAEEMTNSEYKNAESTLVGVTVCFIIFLAFEFLMQLIGVSLLYSQVNLIQIFLHLLGCLFTTWFILE